MQALRDWLGADGFDALKVGAVDWGIKLTTALVLLLVGMWLIRRITTLTRAGMVRTGQDVVLIEFVRNLVSGALMALLLVAVLSQAGVPIASLLAVLGAAGLAVALALKDSLANLAAGVMLIVLRPFKAGDYVEAAGEGGSVVQVKLFFTKLATPDNKEITIPNNQITTNPIINYSARDQRRIDMMVGVAYQADAAHAMRVISEVLGRDERVLSDPAPTLMIDSLNESSVDIAVRPWVKTADYWPARGDLYRDIKLGLEAAGIEIPFPQRTVHVIGSASPAEIAASAGAD